MAQITWIILYGEDNYVSYNDSNLATRFYHGYRLNQEDTIDHLRRDGADQVSVIVVNNDPTIPALKRVKEFCQAGYTYSSTPIEGPMTYRLRRMTTD